MKYFIYNDDDNIVYGVTDNENLIDDLAINYGVTDYNVGQTTYEDYDIYNNKYILENGEIVLNPNYEEEELTKAKIAKSNENIAKCNEKRYTQEFLITLQDKECLFDTTNQTQADLLTAAAVTSTGATYNNWVCNNGTTIDLTASDVQEIFARFFMLVSPLYTIEKQYAEAIEACKTVEEVEAIEINYEIN